MLYTNITVFSYSTVIKGMKVDFFKVKGTFAGKKYNKFIKAGNWVPLYQEPRTNIRGTRVR